MKTGVWGAVVAVCAGCALVTAAHAQPPRSDIIWARQAPAASITLDGVLDEPAWSKAQSILVRYRVDNGIPGSGWQEEGGKLLRDSTRAVVKFLTVGNQLYLGFEVPDSSIGGAVDFNRFDGILMSIKDHSSVGHPKPPAEYFYAWWYPDVCDPSPSAPGKMPDFHGQWGNRVSFCDPRSPAQIAAWDAVTKVHGLSNSDAAADTGYTVEMRMDLGVMGYDVTTAAGDIIEFNLTIYDCDWFWPLSLARFGSNRTWWQSPWGNAMWYNQVQVHSKPSVTTTPGPLPTIGPDMTLHASAAATPVIDGQLTDAAWATADSFHVKYDDNTLRDSYPGVLKWRSGQFQPAVNGGVATVFDPGDATIKWFTKGDVLYLGFNARDQFVQDVNLVDRWDGFIVSINDRFIRGRDRNLAGRRITFHVGPGGAGVAEDYLLALRDSLGAAQFALALKPGTTVDTTGMNVDQGYTAELSINLTALGYPTGLGDRTLWFGVDMLDGDSFTPSTLSYGTRTWFAREYENECCPANVYMQPAANTLDAEVADGAGARFAVLGNQPNPFRSSTRVRYALDRPSRVTLDLFDLSGRRVATRSLGVQSGRTLEATFTEPKLKTGVYLLRLRAVDVESGELRSTPAAKIMVMD